MQQNPFNRVNTLHSLRRTSPKGGPFVGTCIKCGTEGLTIAEMEGCPNPLGMTVGESILEAIDPNAVR